MRTFSQAVVWQVFLGHRISRILIIDDDLALLAGLAEMPSLRLWRVEIATCHQSAFAVSMAQQGQYDVILCDCWMPHMNGLDLLPLLRRTAPQASILMMSGAVTEAVRDAAFSHGAKLFLSKPFDREEVTMTIKQVLKEHHASEDR